MRRTFLGLFMGLVLSLQAAPARAQVYGGVVAAPAPYRINSYFAAPGLYGTSYGAMSVGVPQTYTAFSSPYGAGYGYGYAPYGLLPSRYGVGLWRPGFVAPGYVYGASYYRAPLYRTYAAPYVPTTVVRPAAAPLGVYAPGFGPPAYYSW